MVYKTDFFQRVSWSQLVNTDPFLISLTLNVMHVCVCVTLNVYHCMHAHQDYMSLAPVLLAVCISNATYQVVENACGFMSD